MKNLNQILTQMFALKMSITKGLTGNSGISQLDLTDSEKIARAQKNFKLSQVSHEFRKKAL